MCYAFRNAAETMGYIHICISILYVYCTNSSHVVTMLCMCVWIYICCTNSSHVVRLAMAVHCIAIQNASCPVNADWSRWAHAWMLYLAQLLTQHAKRICSKMAATQVAIRPWHHEQNLMHMQAGRRAGRQGSLGNDKYGLILHIEQQHDGLQRKLTKLQRETWTAEVPHTSTQAQKSNQLARISNTCHSS